MHEFKTRHKEGKKKGRKGGNIYKGHQTTQEGDTQALAVEIEGTKSTLKLERQWQGEKLFSRPRAGHWQVSRAPLSRKMTEAWLRLWITLNGRSRQHGEKCTGWEPGRSWFHTVRGKWKKPWKRMILAYNRPSTRNCGMNEWTCECLSACSTGSWSLKNSRSRIPRALC